MTIHLPHDLESSIQATAHHGRFATVDDAMAEAGRFMLREISQGQPKHRGNGIDRPRAASSRRDGRARGRRHEAATGRNLAGKSGPGKRMALRVLSGKKEFIVTRNDVAGFVH
jgi:hypothetical protein